MCYMMNCKVSRTYLHLKINLINRPCSYCSQLRHIYHIKYCKLCIWNLMHLHTCHLDRWQYSYLLLRNAHHCKRDILCCYLHKCCILKLKCHIVSRTNCLDINHWCKMCNYWIPPHYKSSRMYHKLYKFDHYYLHICHLDTLLSKCYYLKTSSFDR